MAIAATWLTTATNITTSTALYTTSTTAYARDLVITNAGTNSGYVSVGTGVTSAAATAGYVIPAGGSVILTQCQVPTSTIIYGYSASGTNFSIGQGSLVTYV